jgi:hypothetical protein
MGLKYSVLLLYAEGTNVYDQTVWIFPLLFISSPRDSELTVDVYSAETLNMWVTITITGFYLASVYNVYAVRSQNISIVTNSHHFVFVVPEFHF